MGVGQRLLHDIRGIDAGGQAAIEVDGDHPLQSVAVLNEQLVPRRVITAAARSISSSAPGRCGRVIG